MKKEYIEPTFQVIKLEVHKMLMMSNPEETSNGKLNVSFSNNESFDGDFE